MRSTWMRPMPTETTGIGGIEEAAGSLFFSSSSPGLYGGGGGGGGGRGHPILGRRIDVWESGKGIASSVLSPAFFWVLAWVLPIPLPRVDVFQPRFPSWGRGSSRDGPCFQSRRRTGSEKSHDPGPFHARWVCLGTSKWVRLFHSHPLLQPPQWTGDDPTRVLRASEGCRSAHTRHDLVHSTHAWIQAQVRRVATSK